MTELTIWDALNILQYVRDEDLSNVIKSYQIFADVMKYPYIEELYSRKLHNKFGNQFDFLHTSTLTWQQIYESAVYIHKQIEYDHPLATVNHPRIAAYEYKILYLLAPELIHNYIAHAVYDADLDTIQFLTEIGIEFDQDALNMFALDEKYDILEFLGQEPDDSILEDAIEYDSVSLVKYLLDKDIVTIADVRRFGRKLQKNVRQYIK